jgi:hypothetical protein
MADRPAKRPDDQATVTHTPGVLNRLSVHMHLCIRRAADLVVGEPFLRICN